MALSKAAQYTKTREALLSVAHEMFAERGYADTSIQDIVEQAQVTRGALYYHFRDKKALFQAVFERFRQAQTQEVITQVAVAEGDTWERTVEMGIPAFLASLSDKSAQRIIFLDGPSVLDPDIWHRNVLGVNFICQSLQQLAVESFIKEAPYETLARLLWGAFLEAALFIVHAPDADKARYEMHQGLMYLVGQLRIDHES